MARLPQTSRTPPGRQPPSDGYWTQKRKDHDEARTGYLLLLVSRWQTGLPSALTEPILVSAEPAVRLQQERLGVRAGPILTACIEHAHIGRDRARGRWWSQPRQPWPQPPPPPRGGPARVGALAPPPLRGRPRPPPRGVGPRPPKPPPPRRSSPASPVSSPASV